MAKLTLNSISQDIFAVNNAASERENIIGMGRAIAFDYAARATNDLHSALKIAEKTDRLINGAQYSALNKKFQQEHFLYAAKIACANNGMQAPETFEDFKKKLPLFKNNQSFLATLMGIYTEVLTPIIPAVYSEAVGMFAEMVTVGVGESYHVTVGSGDIPIFQDSAWGASRSVPRNRFYEKDYTLVPSPRTAQCNWKWAQLVGNNVDFGKYFANITAGIYSKTLVLWNNAMVAAAGNTAMVPSGLIYTFSSQNWVAAANKVAALNGTKISNVVGIGGAVALSKVLPTQVTGATNVNMDAAIATLLGADYTRMGYLGEYMGVRLMPVDDAIVPNTQFSTVQTVLNATQVWLMAGNGYKPLTIAYNEDTPIQLDVDPSKSGDMELAVNITISLDAIALFQSKMALINIS